MKFLGNIEEYLQLEEIDQNSCFLLKEEIPNSLTVLWFEGNESVLLIDGEEREFKKNEIVFLTEFHKLTPISIGKIRMLKFNRPFYCIKDHDAEVGCNGLLFFGAATLPVIEIPKEELEKFETLWKMFLLELSSHDNLQIEMLQMMLKRYIILCTRLFKNQHTPSLHKEENELIRAFNFLVEQHYMKKLGVAEYAEMLNKSPKTLSNAFLKSGNKSPIQFIKDRKILEAKRRLYYSDEPIKSIAYDLGYDDIQSFSRFFKNQTQKSPSQFRSSASSIPVPS